MPHFEKSALFVGAAALLLAFLVLFLLRGQTEPMAEAATPEKVSASSSAKISNPIATPVLPPNRAPEPSVVVPATEAGVAATEEQKFDLMERLQEAAITYNPAAIPLIEPSLYSSDREIREAAADAMVVLGESAGAEALRKAAAKARDPREAVALIERAEYLELPPGKLFTPKQKAAPNRTNRPGTTVP